MNVKKLTAVIVLGPIAGLLGCSALTTPKAQPIYASTPFELPIYKLPDDVTPDSPRIFGHFCKLGTSCLALDPRPFEPCLLSTKSCSEKAVEPMLVTPPKEFVPLPWVQSY